MKVLIYSNGVVNHAYDAADSCIECDVLFYNNNVCGLHCVLKYCPYCGVRLNGQVTA